MAKETLVEELQKHIKAVEKEKGEFTLAILALMKDRWRNRWRFSLSAPWINEIGKGPATAYFYPRIIGRLDENLLAMLEDVAVFYIGHPLVQDIIKEVGIDYQTPLVMNGRRFGSIEFEEIILL
jgi:hypothetical protein